MTKNIVLEEAAEQLRDALGSRLEEITVTRAAFGLFFSGVKLSTGQGGLCFTPVKELPEAVCCPSSARAMPLSGRLSGRTAAQYLDDLFSDNVLKKTLGVAAMNALSSLVWSEQPPRKYRVETGKNAFDELEPEKHCKTVVVGALVPMLKRLLASGCDFRVLEQDCRTLKGRELEHYAPAEDADKYVPDADLLVITGVTVLNDTLPALLAMAKPGAEILVTGPTASMLPDALFRRGVTMAGGVLVTDADRVLDLICEGGSGYHFFGKYAERTVIRRP